MASSSPIKSMDHPKPNLTPADPHPLKCPRCDSSNTKFCYYNNYSLSQPRHFCKACKRYWTRGGTLRNVPVGGGCRKNKRSKRPPSDPPVSTTRLPPDLSTSTPPSTSTNPIHNTPLFNYNNSIELNFPFSTFRVSSEFDLHSQMNGFSSGLGPADHHHAAAMTNGDFKNGFKPYHDVTPLSGHFFGSSMASLLASTPMPNYEEDPGKDIVKSQVEHNRSVWNPNPNPNPTDLQINSSDPSSLLANLGAAWFDPSNMGSSVPSLI